MTLNPYDLCPNCGGRGLIAVGISDINAICPECDGSGNGETTRLRDRIATLEAKLARLQIDLAYEQSERKAAQEMLGELPQLNDELRELLHAAEMRNHAYASGEAIQDMAQEIAELQAELAALRPWAEVGKRAVREHWYLATRDMLCCHRWYGDGHAPDCLLAQLEADND